MLSHLFASDFVQSDTTQNWLCLSTNDGCWLFEFTSDKMLVKAVRRVYWLCENSVTRFELSTIYTHMFFLTACWNDIYRILQHFIFNRSLFLCCHIHIFWTYQVCVHFTFSYFFHAWMFDSYFSLALYLLYSNDLLP